MLNFKFKPLKHICMSAVKVKQSSIQGQLQAFDKQIRDLENKCRDTEKLLNNINNSVFVWASQDVYKEIDNKLKITARADYEFTTGKQLYFNLKNLGSANKVNDMLKQMVKLLHQLEANSKLAMQLTNKLANSIDIKVFSKKNKIYKQFIKYINRYIKNKYTIYDNVGLDEKDSICFSRTFRIFYPGIISPYYLTLVTRSVKRINQRLFDRQFQRLKFFTPIELFTTNLKVAPNKLKNGVVVDTPEDIIKGVTYLAHLNNWEVLNGMPDLKSRFIQVGDKLKVVRPDNIDVKFPVITIKGNFNVNDVIDDICLLFNTSKESIQPLTLSDGIQVTLLPVHP